MIKVKFYENNHRYAISTEGHAEYAPIGQDIVCAAVSILMQTYGNYVTEHEENRSWINLEVKLEDGESNVEVLDPEDSIKDIYYMTMEGLEDIQRVYPAYISLEYNPQK
ncbi:ribosomal-processing cysteine protease Prp [Pseudobutyrivibrio sp.]